MTRMSPLYSSKSSRERCGRSRDVHITDIANMSYDDNYYKSYGLIYDPTSYICYHTRAVTYVILSYIYKYKYEVRFALRKWVRGTI